MTHGPLGRTQARFAVAFLTSAIGAALLVAVGTNAHAQTRSSLPAPSRTAFKCEAGGKVTYSDAPCEGAKRVDLQPTRGLDSSSGRSAIGSDVRNERFREQFAEAVKPVTGLSPRQFEVRRKRVNLSAASQAECARLDRDLGSLERSAATAGSQTRLEADRSLLLARQRSFSLGC